MPKGLIIGGGIAGLAAAIALRKCGHEVEVYEQASELAEVGAGLSIWGNGLHVLNELEVAGYVEASIPLSGGVVRTSSGEVLSGYSSADMPELSTDLARMFHRAELLDVLKSALPFDVIRLGKRCSGCRGTAEGVEAVFEDGTRAPGDYLIGADGIHSSIRMQLFGSSPPRYAGYTAWRAVVPFAGDFEPGETLGRGARFGAFPLANERVYWFGVRTTSPGGSAPQGEKAYLAEYFRTWHTPIPALIEIAEEAHILRNDIIDRPPIRSWGRGRVVLAGDAAHPMTPNMGQGACQALEDASTLKRVFGEEHDIERALRRYERHRIERANAFVRQSFLYGWCAQVSLGPAVWMRNTLMRLMPKSIRISQIKKMLAPQNTGTSGS